MENPGREGCDRGPFQVIRISEVAILYGPSRPCPFGVTFEKILIAPRDGRANSYQVAILHRALTHELELRIDAVRRGYQRLGEGIRSTDFPESDSVVRLFGKRLSASWRMEVIAAYKRAVRACGYHTRGTKAEPHSNNFEGLATARTEIRIIFTWKHGDLQSTDGALHKKPGRRSARQGQAVHAAAL
jgi:hypothetical protein